MGNMNKKEKKKLIILALLTFVGLPTTYYVSMEDEELVSDTPISSNTAAATVPTTFTATPNAEAGSVGDESEPRFVNISRATDALAAQIVASSPNQNEALLNEGIKQSSRLFNTLLQNKTIQVQIAEADLAIKKANLQALQIDQEFKKTEKEVDVLVDSEMLPPPLADVRTPVARIPDQIIDELPAPPIEQEKETIYEEFFLKGVSTNGDGLVAVGTYRGKSLVLRNGSLINGVYRVTEITQAGLVLEKQGKSFPFNVNI